MRHLPLIAAAFFSAACAPPQAPKELEQLACFIFEHAADEDEELLAEALNNLDAWFRAGHEEDAEEGYQINLLAQSAVSDLSGDDIHHLSDDLVGAAIATDYQNHAVNRVVRASALEDWEVIMDDLYEYYNKRWTNGGDCLEGQSCLTSEATSNSELKVIGVSITSRNDIQYRWVEMDTGWAFVHRSWLIERPTVSSDAVDPNSQYYLAVTLPGTKSLRLQATWIDTKIIGVSVPKYMVVDTMEDQGDILGEWMDEH